MYRIRISCVVYRISCIVYTIYDSRYTCNVDEGDPTQASESRIKTNEFIKIDGFETVESSFA